MVLVQKVDHLHSTIKERHMTHQDTGERFALDNLTYDLLAIVHEKSKALEAYTKYESDAQGDLAISQLLLQIRQQDEHAIQQITQHLGRLMKGQHGIASEPLGDGTDTARLAST